MAPTCTHFARFLLLAVVAFRSTEAQDYDFSVSPIKCYICEGAANNSTCADPFEDSTDHKICDQGMCLKWTKYKDGVLQMVRACTTDVDFHLTMIDGVCRTERNGNGYLCMCGKNMCNSAQKTFIPGMGQTLFQLCTFWVTVGVFSLFPHWIFHTFWRQGHWS